MPEIIGMRRGSTVVDKVYRGTTQVWPAPTPTDYELNFAGDTYILISGINFSLSVNNEIRYVINQVTLPTDRREVIWADTPPGTVAVNSFYSREDGATYRPNRGSNGENLAGVAQVFNQDFYIREDANGGLGPFVSTGLDDTYSGDSGQSNLGTFTSTITDLYIGAGGSDFWSGFTGVIKDFKLYDATDTLIHHWPINDNSTTIVDIVGGANGTLTIGSGSWAAVGGGGGAGDGGIYRGDPAAPPPPEANRVYLGSTANPVFLGSTDNPVYLGSNGQ